VSPGSLVVEHSTRNPKIKGSNPAITFGREKNKKKLSKVSKNVEQLNVCREIGLLLSSAYLLNRVACLCCYLAPM